MITLEISERELRLTAFAVGLMMNRSYAMANEYGQNKSDPKAKEWFNKAIADAKDCEALRAKLLELIPK